MVVPSVFVSPAKVLKDLLGFDTLGHNKLYIASNDRMSTAQQLEI
jgi:hypothetical protein